MRKLLLGILLAGLTASAFATDGIRMVGFNTVSMGRGGTNIGVFDNTGLMMTNPAGIAFLPSPVLEGNFSLMVPNLHFSNALNSADGTTNYFPLPAVGYVRQHENSNWFFGVGAFTQGGMGADFMLNHDLFRDQTGALVPQEYHSKLAIMQGGITVAYKITPKFSVGASAHLVYGQLEFSMPYSLSPSIMKGIAAGTPLTFGEIFSMNPAAGGFGYSEVTAAAKMQNLTAWGFNGKLGVALVASDAVTMGLSFTTATPLTFKNGTASMDMTAQMTNALGKAIGAAMAKGYTQAQAQAAVMAQFAGMGIDMSKGVAAGYDLQAKLSTPTCLGFGIGIKASDNLRFSFDGEVIGWSSAFDKMSISLSNGNNANINTMLGNTGSFSIDFPMLWKNSYCVRVGGEYDATSDLTLRAGYAYGSNPVPEATVFPVFPAIVENHVTVGASYAILPVLKVHVAYEMALSMTETASASSFIAQEYNGSSSKLGENIFHIALTWSM